MLLKKTSRCLKIRRRGSFWNSRDGTSNVGTIRRRSLSATSAMSIRMIEEGQTMPSEGHWAQMSLQRKAGSGFSAHQLHRTGKPPAMESLKHKHKKTLGRCPIYDRRRDSATLIVSSEEILNEGYGREWPRRTTGGMWVRPRKHSPYPQLQTQSWVVTDAARETGVTPICELSIQMKVFGMKLEIVWRHPEED
jgi:hypothetical protein